MNIKNSISQDISIPENMIDDAIKVARSHVKIFKINKKSGGTREIFHPSKKLKTIQYWLMHSIFNKMPIHEASMAYRDGLSILHNAQKHKHNRFFLKMDLIDFFPSISFDDFLPILRGWNKSQSLEWDLDKDAESLINNVCFYKNDRLAIGYPSSPVISNIVMSDFDSNISNLISNDKYGMAVYTRYADDLVFSTDKYGACRDIRIEIEKVVRSTKSPKISINSSKTKLGSSTGGSAGVTGLKICPDGHITIYRKQKDNIRLMLSLYKKGLLNKSDENSLLGHLSYCRHVAPQFYTTLSNKYFKEIHELRSKSININP